MATNEPSSRPTRVASLRRSFFSSGLLLRFIFALIVSILIVMAFFATAAMSR